MMLLLVMAIMIAIPMAYSSGLVYGRRTAAKREIEWESPKIIKPKVVESWPDVIRTPDGFLNLVRDALPKDKGLIYELTVGEYKLPKGQRRGYYDDPQPGDTSVTITIFDPIANEELDELTYYENQSCLEAPSGRTTLFRNEIADKVNDLIVKRQKSKMIGHKEIVS